MTDNTTLNPGLSGDVIRDVDRGTAKTQVVQIDAGGQAQEALVSATNPMPVGDPYTRLGAVLQYQELLATQAAAVNGFIPFETPSFLIG